MERTTQRNHFESLANSDELSELFNTSLVFARLGKKKLELGGSILWINSDYDPRDGGTYIVQAHQNGNIITAIQIGKLLTSLYERGQVMQVGFSPLTQINFSRDAIMREQWQVGIFDQELNQARADNISQELATKAASNLRNFLPRGVKIPKYRIEAVDLAKVYRR